MKQPGRGWGQPVNELDAACREFQQCQRCLTIDYQQENSDKKCDTSGFPISQILSAITFTDSETICKKRHRFSECSFQKCRCEAIFYRKILKLFFKNSIDNKYQHEGGKFQPKNTCKPVVTGRTEWKCCGRYPDRKPYNRVTRNCRNPEL